MPSPYSLFMKRGARCIVYSVLQVIYANTISMISSSVNLQCISGLCLLATNIACVATVQVDLAVPSHQGGVGHYFGTVEAPPSSVRHPLHHGVQHLIQICIRLVSGELFRWQDILRVCLKCTLYEGWEECVGLPPEIWERGQPRPKLSNIIWTAIFWWNAALSSGGQNITT